MEDVSVSQTLCIYGKKNPKHDLVCNCILKGDLTSKYAVGCLHMVRLKETLQT